LQLDEADYFLCHVTLSTKSLACGKGSLSSNAKDWLPWLLVPVSRHRQQRLRFGAACQPPEPATALKPSASMNLEDK
jgi:hypothetical protein